MSAAVKNPDFLLYHYYPSIPGASIAAGLFTLITCVHCLLAYRSRGRFLIALIIGGFLELFGFALRAYSATVPGNIGLYIMQAVLILVAPSLIAASIYMILGRIILMTGGEKYSMIRRSRLTKIFVWSDFAAFNLQGNGGGLLASRSATVVKVGQYIVIVGLFAQVLVFGFFVVVAVVFHKRLHATPTPMSTSAPWQKHLYVLYVSSTLIMVRCIFRIVEFIQGNDGYLMGHELYQYIFDAALMLAVLILFSLIHPGKIRGFIERNKERLERTRESSGSVIALEERPLWRKIF